MNVMKFKLACARQVQHLDDTGQAVKLLDMLESSEESVNVLEIYVSDNYSDATIHALHAACAAASQRVTAAVCATYAIYAADAASGTVTKAMEDYQLKLFNEIFIDKEN